MKEKTHVHGSTIDIMITFSDETIENVRIDPPDVISDHELVLCCIPLGLCIAHPVTRVVRSWHGA